MRIAPGPLGLQRQRRFDARSLKYRIRDKLATFGSRHAADVAVAMSRGVSREDATRVLGGTSAASRTPTSVYAKRHPWDPAQPGNSCTGHAAVRLWVNGRKWNKSVAFLDALAIAVYREAVRIDRQVHGYDFGGDDPGATMLALAKAGVNFGMWGTYYWGYTRAEIEMADRAGKHGILGTWWRTGMDLADRKHGVFRYDGEYRGGHAIYRAGADMDDGYGAYDNSWKRTNWGAQDTPGATRAVGMGIMPYEDEERAMSEDGEFLIVDELPDDALAFAYDG